MTLTYVWILYYVATLSMCGDFHEVLVVYGTQAACESARHRQIDMQIDKIQTAQHLSCVRTNYEKPRK